MLNLYITIMSALHDRLDRDERGDVLGFLAIGALVISVVVFALPGVRSLVTQVLTKIGDGITSL